MGGTATHRASAGAPVQDRQTCADAASDGGASGNVSAPKQESAPINIGI